GEVEVDRSAALAFAIEDLLQVAHQFGPRDQGAVAGDLGLVSLEDGVYRGICHALGGTDYTFAEVVSDNLAAVVDFHDAGEDQTVEVRAQAADICRQFEREHWHGTVGEVDAGAAEAGFLIQSGVGRDVLSDVGDVDLEFEIIVREHAD